MTTLDRKTVDSFRHSVGEDAFKHIVQEVIKDSEALLKRLQKGASRNDCGEVKNATHQMRSTALLFGADELAGACADLEELCDDGHEPTPDVIRKKLDLVATRFTSARRSLKRELRMHFAK